MSATRLGIPGQKEMSAGNHDMSGRILLLIGPSGSGKTAYCRQFLREGLELSNSCLYVNCRPSISEATIRSVISASPAFESPTILTIIKPKDETLTSDPIAHILAGFKDLQIRVVIDSLTDLVARLPENEVQKFVAGLYDLFKATGNVSAIFTISSPPSSPMVETLGSIVDGILQIRQHEDSEGLITQDIRILSLKSNHQVVPKWTRFTIEESGSLQFTASPAAAGTTTERCKLCNGIIAGESASAGSDGPFHPKCFDTYRKLGDIYGSNVIYSLQPGVVNANFFFVDIVGLSDPYLSVENQIKKINALNSLVASCDAFSKISRNNKVILPTGDGMAIGFLLNPELPLLLSIQLHRKLRTLNEKSSLQDRLEVRIGLSSGPVFVVNDINDNQNVWGPGIVLGRRVMDLGDAGHILLAGNIAEPLINLKDEYREIIRLVSPAYTVKHGEIIKLYSAVGRDFGNAATPARSLQ